MKDVTDAEFVELELKTICPSADQWSDEYMHEKSLKAAANEARQLVREAFAKLDRIDGNRDLTPEAKQRQRSKIAEEFGTTAANSATLKRVTRGRGQRHGEVGAEN